MRVTRRRSLCSAAMPVALCVAIALAGCGAATQTARPADPPAGSAAPARSAAAGPTTATTTTTTGASTGADPARAPARRLVLRASATHWRLPAPVYRTVAVAHGERIYVLGGHDSAGGTTSNVYELDLTSGHTSRAGTLALPTHGAAAAALGGRLLLFGGASTVVHDVVQQFRPGRHAATVVGRMPGPRADVTAAVLGHTVVLVGGFDGVGPQRDVWAVSDGLHFRVIARLAQAVRYPAVVAYGNSVYLFGGLISGGEYSGQFSTLIQRVRLDGRTARVVGHLPTPTAHAMGALVGGRVLVIGGSTPGGPTAAILRFDPQTGRITRAARLPHPLTDAAVATVGDSAYLLGGISTRPLAGVIAVRLAPARRRSVRPSRPVAAQRIHVSAGAVDMAAGDGALWVSGFGAISRLDPSSGRLVARIRTPDTGDYSGIAVGPQAVWVSETPTDRVYRIDPQSDRVVASIRVPGPPTAVAVGGGRVWVGISSALGRLVQIDPRTDRMSGREIDDIGPGPGQVAYGQLSYGRGAVWVQSTSPPSVARIDPASGRATTVIPAESVPAGFAGAGLAFGDGALWTNQGDAVNRLDPTTGAVEASARVPRAEKIALGDGEVWVIAYPKSSSPTVFDPARHSAALWELDPASARIVGEPLPLNDDEPIAIATTPGSVWVADYLRSTITRFALVRCHTTACR